MIIRLSYASLDFLACVRVDILLLFLCLINTVSSFKMSELPLEVASDSHIQVNSFPGGSQVTFRIILFCFSVSVVWGLPL